MLSYLAPPWFSAPAADSPPYGPKMPLLRHTLYKLQQRFFLHLIFSSTPVRACFFAPDRGNFLPKFPLVKPTRESYGLEEEQLLSACQVRESGGQRAMPAHAQQTTL